MSTVHVNSRTKKKQKEPSSTHNRTHNGIKYSAPQVPKNGAIIFPTDPVCEQYTAQLIYRIDNNCRTREPGVPYGVF
jgi:hypothetical protein